LVLVAPHIGEARLMPLQENILKQLNFVILNFRSDNRGEFINKIVAQLLEKALSFN
jgi:hypothetical protein